MVLATRIALKRMPSARPAGKTTVAGAQRAGSNKCGLEWRMAFEKAPELLETERLVLRRPVLEDASAIFERYAGDPDVTRFLGWPTHRDAADSRSFIEFADSEWNRWPAGPYLIYTPDGVLRGGTGLAFEHVHRASTGYVLAKDSWGRGYATEVLRKMVELARMLAVSELFALCYPEHEASIRVLEKCGFQRDPILKQSPLPNLQQGPVDVLCYARQLVG